MEVKTDKLIVLVLSVKKSCQNHQLLQKWWEVVKGGQRRELNVLKILRISGALLILLWKCDNLAGVDFSGER